MKYLILSLMFFVLQSCAPASSPAPTEKPSTPISTVPPDTTTTPVGTSPPDTTVAPVDSSAPATPVLPVSPSAISLTYYSLSTVVHPDGWINKTATLTGSCVVYLTKTYCWDNGIQTIPAWVYNHLTIGPLTYDYWSYCSGGCLPADAYLAPTFVDATLITRITQIKIDATLAGTPKQVSCTQTNSILNCVDFSIDLNQTPL